MTEIENISYSFQQSLMTTTQVKNANMMQQALMNFSTSQKSKELSSITNEDGFFDSSNEHAIDINER